MRKRKVLIITVIALILTQMVFLHDRTWVLAQETETIDEADGAVCIEQSSEVQKKKQFLENGEEVMEGESERKGESESKLITERLPDRKDESESETITEKQSETELTNHETPGFKVYLKYIFATVSGVLLLLILLLLFKKDNRKTERKEDSRVVVFWADRKEKIIIPIPEKGKVTLGRKGKADVALKDDRGLADIHMALWYDQGRFWVEKQQTEKSLKFNGRELAQGEVRALYNQAVLEIGNIRYWFIEKTDETK